MTMQFAQHAPSNQREPTDRYLHPSHYPFEECIHEEIKSLKELYEYIEISQEMISQLRQDSGNSKNYGDAVEEILYKELSGYSGMIDAHKLVEEKIFDMLEVDEGMKAGEISYIGCGVKRKKIFTSLFDSTTKTLYYFLKR